MASFAGERSELQRHLTSQSRPAILALMGAAVFLLLIACSNVANLFLVRAPLRARDFAVRAARGLFRSVVAAAEKLLTLFLGGKDFYDPKFMRAGPKEDLP